MGKGGKSGKSAVGKALGIAGLAVGGWAPWVFGVKSGFAGAIMGLSLGQTIASALSQDDTTTQTSSFDNKMNSVSPDSRIPLLYGTRKIGGQQTYHETNVDAQWLVKDIVLGEGTFSGGYGITANGYITKLNGSIGTLIRQYNSAEDYTYQSINSDYNPVFGLINWKYPDAAVWIYTSDEPTGNDKDLVLYYNGNEHHIKLQDTSDLESDSSNDFSCSMPLLYQYIEGIHYDTPFANDGWQVINPVVCSDSPEDLGELNRTECYKTPAMIHFSKYATGDSWVQFYNGTQGAPSYYMRTGGYPNMAYLHAYLKYTEKLGSGNPTVTMIAQGRNVYDTRQKVWRYSENPAMIVRDYLLNKVFGSGEYITESMLDEDSFIETANYCDALVTTTDGAGRSVTEPRYRLNILFNDKKTYLEHLQEMLACFSGFLIFSNGKVALKVEKAEGSVYSFNDDNIVQGSMSYKTDSSADSPNKYVMHYIEPVLDWVSETAIVEDLVDQTTRNKIISKDIQLTGVTSQGQALRLGRIYRDLVRLCPVTMTFKTGAQAMHIEPGDIVKVSHNIIIDGAETSLFKDMPVRVLEIQEDSGEYTLTCRQYNPSIYDDSLGGNLNVHSYVGDIKEETLLPTAVPQATNLSCYTVYRQLSDGNTGYDIVVSYDLPDGYSLETGLVYYKTNHVDSTEVGTISENVPGDEIGFSLDWKYAGDSPNKVIIPGAKVGDIYKVKVITRNKKGDLSSDANAVTATVTVGLKTTIPNTPQNFHYDFTNGFNFYWDDVTNSDVDFYELRLDDKCGTLGDNLLAKCTGTSCSATLTNRQGTIYLFAHNASKSYSYPASINYNVPKPIAPILTLEQLLRGINVTADSFPNNVTGMNLYVSAEGYSEKFSLTTNVYSFYNNTGLYTFKAAFTDIFGEGYMGMEKTASIVATVDPQWIKDESISVDKVDSAVKQAIQNANNSVTELLNINTNIDKIVSDQKTTNDSFTNQISSINTDISGLTSTVSANKTNQDSTNDSLKSLIQQNADNITTAVNDYKNADTALSSQIKQNADSITSTVQANKDSQDKINTSVASDISQIKQTATSLSSTVVSNKDSQDTTNASMESQITQNSNSITSIVTNLNKQPSDTGYSSFTQLNDAINLRVVKGDVINQINLTSDGTLIDGKFLHVTGTTQFDSNIIANGMIQAGAITADKLAAGTITLGSNTVSGFTGGAVTLDTNGMTVAKTNGSSLLFGSNGMVFRDSNQQVFNAVGKQVVGVCRNGQRVTFKSPWDEIPTVVVAPQNMVISAPAYSTSTITLHAYATNVSTTGFNVVCYSGISNGVGIIAQNLSSGTMSWNNNYGGGNWWGRQSCNVSFQVPANISRVTITGHEAYTMTGVGNFQVYCSDNLSVTVNGSQVINESLNNGHTIFWGINSGNGGVNIGSTYEGVDGTAQYGITTGTITFPFSHDISVSPNASINVVLSADHQVFTGWITNKGLTGRLVIDSIVINVDSEQPLDTNGTAVFIATDSANSENYSVS